MIVALWRFRPDDDHNADTPHNNLELIYCSRFPDKPLDRALESIQIGDENHLAVYYYRSSKYYGIRTYISPKLIALLPNSAPTLTSKQALYNYLYLEKLYVESIPDDHLERIADLVSRDNQADDGDDGTNT